MGCFLPRNRLDLKKFNERFNYQLKGTWDQQVKNNYDIANANPQNHPVLQMKVDTLQAARQKMNQVFQMTKSKLYTQYIERCQSQIKEIDATPFGSDNTNLRVTIHRPKQFKTKDQYRPCIIYAHGGGACMLTASDFDAIVCRMALDSDCIAVNVDYRLAPEAKAPKGILDFYAAIKWTVKNAKELKINKKKVCVMGDSGGGYISTGACMKLAENNESNLVKLFVPVVPMTTNYFINTEIQDMSQVEKLRANVMNVVFQLLAEDKVKQRQDQYIFPNLMSDKIAEKFPKTVIMTSEFDYFRKGAEELANRLNRNGRLLGMCIHPGVDHTWFMYFKFIRANYHYNNVKYILKKWL